MELCYPLWQNNILIISTFQSLLELLAAILGCSSFGMFLCDRFSFFPLSRDYQFEWEVESIDLEEALWC